MTASVAVPRRTEASRGRRPHGYGTGMPLSRLESRKAVYLKTDGNGIDGAAETWVVASSIGAAE